uniref:Uncharacterized protein n=1 Tax=Setaria viridis TaxID=4556 RepID=A0A4U6V5X8_SETVI|nr:hypothetical protein SEVIR_4G257000v2 [Setaria viridis]
MRGMGEAGLVVTTMCLGVVNLAGEGIHHGVGSTSAHAMAPATEMQDTPEKTAVEADATAAAASTTTVASMGRLAGRRDAIRGRLRLDRRNTCGADVSQVGSSRCSAAQARPGARRGTPARSGSCRARRRKKISLKESARRKGESGTIGGGASTQKYAGRWSF